MGKIMSPKVSVILPTYNRARTLPRAIESVLAQTYTDYDLLIVDDGSTDDTAAVLRPYAERDNVRVIYQPNGGAAAARNAGIAATTGEYVAFQDSDDEWLPEKLKVAVNVLEGQSQPVGVFYSDMYKTYPDGRTEILEAPDVTAGVLMNEATLDYSVVCIGNQAAVVRRDCFERHGTFDALLPRFIDLELFLRLSSHVAFHHEKAPLVIWHEGPGISSNKKALVQARRYLIKKYGPQLAQTRWYLAAQCYQTAMAYADLPDSPGVCRFAARAILACPAHTVIRHKSLDLLEEHSPGPLGPALRRLRGRGVREASKQFQS